MGRFVEWRGKLYPRELLEPPLDNPGACPVCGGLGLIPESIDEERFDVMVNCWKCVKPKEKKNEHDRDKT